MPLELSQYRLAKEIDVPAQRIGAIVAGKRAVTADTDCDCAAFLACLMAAGASSTRHRGGGEGAGAGAASDQTAGEHDGVMRGSAHNALQQAHSAPQGAYVVAIPARRFVGVLAVYPYH